MPTDDPRDRRPRRPARPASRGGGGTPAPRQPSGRPPQQRPPQQRPPQQRPQRPQGGGRPAQPQRRGQPGQGGQPAQQTNLATYVDLHVEFGNVSKVVRVLRSEVTKLLTRMLLAGDTLIVWVQRQETEQWMELSVGGNKAWTIREAKDSKRRIARARILTLQEFRDMYARRASEVEDERGQLDEDLGGGHDPDDDDHSNQF